MKIEIHSVCVDHGDGSCSTEFYFFKEHVELILEHANETGDDSYTSNEGSFRTLVMKVPDGTVDLYDNIVTPLTHLLSLYEGQKDDDFVENLTDLLPPDHRKHVEILVEDVPSGSKMLFITETYGNVRITNRRGWHPSYDGEFTEENFWNSPKLRFLRGRN